MIDVYRRKIDMKKNKRKKYILKVINYNDNMNEIDIYKEQKMI